MPINALNRLTCAAAVAFLVSCTPMPSQPGAPDSARISFPSANADTTAIGLQKRKVDSLLPPSLQYLVRQISTPHSFVHKRSNNEPMTYVADYNQGAVFGFDRRGHNTITIGGLNGPHGLFVDHSHNLWVADSANQQVLVYAKNGLTPIRTLAAPNSIPLDVTICPNGKVFVSLVSTANGGAGAIAIYAHDGTMPKSFLQDPQQANNLFITCDVDNNIFTTLLSNGGQPKVDEYVGGREAGLITLPISVGCPYHCGFPAGIKMDSQNNILLDDAYNGTVTEYTEAGSATGRSFFVGGGNCDPYGCHGSEFYDISVNKKGNLVLGANVAQGTAQVYNFPSGSTHRIYIINGRTPLPTGSAFDPGQKY